MSGGVLAAIRDVFRNVWMLLAGDITPSRQIFGQLPVLFRYST